MKAIYELLLVSELRLFWPVGFMFLAQHDLNRTNRSLPSNMLNVLFATHESSP